MFSSRKSALEKEGRKWSAVRIESRSTQMRKDIKEAGNYGGQGLQPGGI